MLAGYAAGVPWLTACLAAYHQYERRAVPPMNRHGVDPQPGGTLGEPVIFSSPATSPKKV